MQTVQAALVATIKVPHGSARKPCLPAEVLDWSESEGHVFTQGESWQARGAEPFKSGEMVEVANIIDLTMVVSRRPVLTAGEGGAS